MFKKKSNVFITLGLLLIGAALFIVIFNTVQSRNADITSEAALNALRNHIEQAEEDGTDSNTSNGQPLYKEHKEISMPVYQVDGEGYDGVLNIPALSLELPVNDKFSYPSLIKTPCRYYGSVYADNMIIAAHNYASHFGYLGSLKQGDAVSFTDGDGNRFDYTVSEVLQINGNDVAAMKEGNWDMTLFTCTVSGRKRITVRLERTDN